LVDDSFIYLRISANIGGGQGWLYNSGEVSNGATSTTFVLLVAALGSLIGYSKWTLAAAYGASLYALAALQYLAWRRDGRVRAVVLAIGVSGGARLLDSFGMETPLLLALVSATALSYRIRGDSALTGLLAGLTALTRPEGVALLGLIGLFELVSHRRLAWRSTLVAMLVFAPWFVFSRWYLGAVLSQTGEIKALQREIGWWATQPGFAISFVQQARFPWLTLPLGVAGFWWVLRHSRRDSFAPLFVGFGVVQVLGYQLLDAPSGYPWYFAPGNAAVDLCVLLLGAWVVDFVARRSALPRVLVASATVLLLIPMLRLGMAPLHQLPGPYRMGDAYRAVAEWTRRHSQPGDTLAATEIGYLGWYSQMPILDIHGLVHPRALPWLRQHNLHWWWDTGERPRFVVVHSPPWTGEPGAEDSWPAETSAEFHAQYREVFRADPVRLYERNVPRR
jgi:hypothetical protein